MLTEEFLNDHVENSALNLNDMELTSNDIESICKFLNKHTNIETLLLEHTGIDDAGVEEIAKISSITHLNLDNNPKLTQDSCKSLGKNHTLKILSLNNNPGIHNGMPDLSACLSIEILFVKNCQIKSLRGIASNNLKFLDVSGNEIDATWLISLASNDRIRTLHLESCGIRSALAFEHSTLDRLNLSHNNIDLASIKALSRNQNIKALMLKFCGITAEKRELLENGRTADRQLDLQGNPCGRREPMPDSLFNSKLSGPLTLSLQPHTGASPSLYPSLNPSPADYVNGNFESTQPRLSPIRTSTSAPLPSKNPSRVGSTQTAINPTANLGLPNIKPSNENSSSYNIKMMVLGGFIAAIGITAVVLSLTVLNAATFGGASFALLGVGIAAALCGAGIFGNYYYKNRGVAEPVITNPLLQP